MTNETPKLYSDEAERALVGSLLISPNVYTDLVDIMGENGHDAFFLHRLGMIYQAIEQLIGTGSAIDIITVSDALKEQNRLEEVGGLAFLTSLVNTTATSLHAPDYAQTVRRYHTRRTLILQAKKLAQIAYDTETAVESPLNEVQETLDRITVSTKKDISDHLIEAGLEYVSMIAELLKQGDQMIGVPTGYKDVDAKTRGIRRRVVTILGGRPSMGKSSFANQSAFRQAQMGLKVGLFTMEDPKEVAFESIACARLRIDSHHYRDDDYNKVTDFIGNSISDLAFQVCDEPYLTPAEIGREMARMEKAMGGLDCVWIDHLAYIHSTDPAENQNIKLGNVMKQMVRLAKRFDSGFVLLHQLSRKVVHRADPTPELSDLRESGHIEQDARVVLFVHRPAYYEPIDEQPDPSSPQDFQIIVRKNFRGPANVGAKLAFIPKYAQITDWTFGQTANMSEYL